MNKLNNHAFREPPVASLADILSNVSSSDGVAWGQDSIMGWDEANQHEKSIIHQPRGARSEGNYPQHSPINPPDCPLSSEPSATASDSFDAVVTPGLRRVAARDRYGSEKGSDDRERGKAGPKNAPHPSQICQDEKSDSHSLSSSSSFPLPSLSFHLTPLARPHQHRISPTSSPQRNRMISTHHQH